MRRKKVKPITFRVRPEGTFLYAEVNIWPTKKAMYVHNPIDGKYEASCGGRVSYTFKGKGVGRKTGLFAELNFNRRDLGMEVVTHEFSHAAFCFAERRKLNLSEAIDCRNWKAGSTKETLDRDGVEERFCYALGVMCNQFVRKCIALGIYPKT